MYQNNRNSQNINERKIQHYQERQQYGYNNTLIEPMDLDNDEDKEKSMYCNYELY
jgi:hypothetical protein